MSTAVEDTNEHGDANENDQPITSCSERSDKNGRLSDQVLLSEMELYYTEVRDVNQKTLAIIRYFAMLYLALIAYMFVGTQYAIEPDRVSELLNPQSSLLEYVPKVRPIESEVAFSGLAILTYGLVGVVFSIGLNLLGLVGVFAWGRSKFLKTRYWKSISYLRQELHGRQVPPEGHRLVALQTGPEAVAHPPYRGKVVRPLVRRHSNVLGYLLVFANMTIVLIAALLFATALDLGLGRISGWNFDLSESYFRSASRMWIGIAVLGHIHITVIQKYFVRDIRRSQFITRTELDPKLLYRKISNMWLRRAIIAIFFISILYACVWPWPSSCFYESPPINWREVHANTMFMMAIAMVIRLCAIARTKYSWKSILCMVVDFSFKSVRVREHLPKEDCKGIDGNLQIRLTKIFIIMLKLKGLGRRNSNSKDDNPAKHSIEKHAAILAREAIREYIACASYGRVCKK